MTSLHIAAIYGDEGLTRRLLEEGYNPNIIETRLRTPLYGAVWERLHSIVELLLDFGACIELASHNGLTALHAAVKRDPVLLELLLQRGGNCNYQDSNGDTLLFHAIAEKKIDALRVLLNHNANPNIPNNTGLLPLFLCVSLDDIPSMILLLDHGADPNGKVGFKHKVSIPSSISSPGITDSNVDGAPIQGRISLEPVPIGTRPHEVYISHSPVSFAMQMGRNEALKRLLLSCENITWNDPTHNGEGLIHYAVRLKNEEILRILLMYGPKVLRNMSNDLGRTPLHIAAQVGNVAAAAMLLHIGYDDINHRDCGGSTPLTEALFNERLELAKLLLDHGADRSIADEFIHGRFQGRPCMIHVGPRKETGHPKELELPRLSRLLQSIEST
ncbi:hypothetical protein ANO14919_133920 [Xylariales sp. No.14919]|nr:hypothetical protein ANO14919_133920 [Xylariales sp. No.14919]